MIAVAAAVTFPVLALACVGVLDLSLAMGERGRLQNAADACALATAADASTAAGALLAHLNGAPEPSQWVDGDGNHWCAVERSRPSLVVGTITLHASAAASIPAGESRPLLTR